MKHSTINYCVWRRVVAVDTKHENGRCFVLDRSQSTL